MYLFHTYWLFNGIFVCLLILYLIFWSVFKFFKSLLKIFDICWILRNFINKMSNIEKLSIDMFSSLVISNFINCFDQKFLKFCQIFDISKIRIFKNLFFILPRFKRSIIPKQSNLVWFLFLALSLFINGKLIQKYRSFIRLIFILIYDYWFWILIHVFIFLNWFLNLEYRELNK